MKASERAQVYGATGHTGRFVVDELLRRRLTPVLAGRDAARIASVRSGDTALDRRVVDLEDQERLQQAIADVRVVVNCAGPFMDTAVPLARAAVTVGAHYLDVSAEQPSAQQLYRELDAPARDAGVVVVPAMAFYGGLADLLVTAALTPESQADHVEIAIGLDHWWPTAGTRVTGSRNTATRLVIRDHALTSLASPAPTVTWSYPPPLGDQEALELPFSETMTIHRHLDVGELRSYLNTAALEELRDSSTPPPPAVDESGRSAQQFVVDVVVRRGSQTRRISASGRDIYAFSAPLVVEGAARLLDGRHLTVGAAAPGEVFDSRDMLAALERDVDGFVIERVWPH